MAKDVTKNRKAESPKQQQQQQQQQQQKQQPQKQQQKQQPQKQQQKQKQKQERAKVTEGIIDKYFFFIAPGERVYRMLHIPRWLPPEAIVILGFLFSVAAAFGFSYAHLHPHAALLASLFVYGNMVSDYMDGRHARATGQCRNGGEILDHFFDPLSFAVIVIGIGASVNRLDLAIGSVLGIYGNAALVFQEAMIMTVLTLKKVGPNEARLLFMGYGVLVWWLKSEAVTVNFLYVSAALSLGQLVIELVRTVNRVNRDGPPPDNTPWQR